MEKDQKNRVVTKYNKYVTIIIIGIIAVLMCTWIFIENLGGGEFNLENSTSYTIESFEATFVNDDWNVSDTLTFENKLLSNTSDSLEFDKINLNNMAANLQLKIKFEGYPEIVLVAGYFDDLFTGNINIKLKEIEDGNVHIFIKAKNSIFSSTINGCKEDYIIYVKEGYTE